MVKQSIKAQEPIKKKSISDFKKNFGFSNSKISTKGDKGDKDDGVITAKNADKPMEWLIMPKGFQDALKLPGIPLGYVTTIAGHSNVGKSTLVNHSIVSAQHQGLIPVIFDTENNFDWHYAIDCGMIATPVYDDIEVEKVDEETGEITTEIENKIVNYDGDFIYFNNMMLIQKYGNINYSTMKTESKRRDEAVIEDVASCVNELLKLQSEGEIDKGFVFIWDSVGSLGCYKGYASNSNSSLWNAGAISQAFKIIFNDKIPRTRKINIPYFNTFIIINKVWNDISTLVPSAALSCGETIYYASRLILLMGGQLKSSIKRLTAISKGETYNYGIQTKLKVMKNQLPSPFNISYEGSAACTSYGLIGIDEIDDFRKMHIKEILDELNKLSSKDNSGVITESDVSFIEEDTME